MSKNKHQHFVPQHYLRQFRVEGTKQICVMRLSPLKYIGLGAINRQCQEDYFYEGEGDKGLDQVLSLIEETLLLSLRVSVKRDIRSQTGYGSSIFGDSAEGANAKGD
ncbi:MAG: DUF4238 domain-containing protein [Chthoniobacteraceae bacterium]